MNVLATRTIQGRTDAGTVESLVLTVFEPYQERADVWRCAFSVSPPSRERLIKAGGADAIGALLGYFTVARGYLEHPSESRTTWQGMFHSGLTWYRRIPEGYQPPEVPAREPNPGNKPILAIRRLGVPDEMGETRELMLTVYRPFSVDEQTWRCGFAVSTGAEDVRYGVGADFIEALLDALAMARLVCRAMIPSEWVAPEWDGFETVEFLPYKVGREYSIDKTKLEAF